MVHEVSFEEFQKIKIRAGRIVRVEDFPKARKPHSSHGLTLAD